jgi:uncharacterized protein YdhG (YjbR/CyaY superfamily)
MLAMVFKKIKPKSIEEYILAAPEEAGEKLWQIHQTIRAAAPGAAESLKWSMPSYSYQRILVTFAVFKKHIGFYPTPSAVESFSKELSKFKTAKGSIQFPLDQKLPLALIHRITQFRAKESLSKDKKWRT